MAYDNIYAFHAAQKSAEKSVENMKVSQYCFFVIAATLIFSIFLMCSEFFRVSNANG